MVATSPSMLSHSWSVVNKIVMRLPSAFIGVGDEWHGCDLQRQALAADFSEDLCARCREGRRQIAHPEGGIEARPKTARRDLADRLGRGPVPKKPTPLAHRGPALGAK